jgi:serine/threonine protein kinase
MQFQKRVYDELRLLMLATPRHSVCTYGAVVVSDKEAHVIMELLPHTLRSYLTSTPYKKLRLEGRVALSLQCVDLLSYLQNSLKVVHADIKTNNILVTDTSLLKLADYGVSHRLLDIDFIAPPRNVTEPRVWNPSQYHYCSKSHTSAATCRIVDTFSFMFVIIEVLLGTKHNFYIALKQYKRIDMSYLSPDDLGGVRGRRKLLVIVKEVIVNERNGCYLERLESALKEILVVEN